MADRQSRTEKATGKRRAEARRKGQVVRSHEVNSVVVLLAVFVVLAVSASKLLGELENVVAHGLANAGNPGTVSDTGIRPTILSTLKTVGTILLPIAAAAAAAGFAANIAQVRFKWSMQALQPRFSHLNPKNGLKRLFGTSGLVETAKALVKLAIIGGIAFMAVWTQLPELGALVGIPPAQLLSELGGRVRQIVFEVIGALLVLAALDYAWQRRKLERSLMMTKQEVKQESRQADIAPEVRGAIRKRQMQASRRRMMAEVPSADVVVVNPTHFAVALRYDPTKPAPEVVAKGADHVAAAIRATAEEHDVPIVSNPPLARTLYRQVELGQLIPEVLFVAVAEVLAYVFRTARGRRRRLRPGLPARA